MKLFNGATAESRQPQSNDFRLPPISLPKGGGALRGIDEKFEVNPVNGSANCSIPFPISNGRNGLNPVLGLHYHSGAGNGPFGIGWQLDIASIQIRTDQTLPTYSSQDVYLFSGADDLVPFQYQDDSGVWIPEKRDQEEFSVERFRPRIENEYARIEKVDHVAYGVYWKVTGRNNVVTLFGRNASARIADPQDPRRIFSWLAEFSYDDKGNWISYEYKSENLQGVSSSSNEQHRLKHLSPIANTYLKRVRYGNTKAYYADPDRSYDPIDPMAVPGSEEEKHCFELVLDYGEHDWEAPQPEEESDLSWDYRADAFSSYRSGFEIRTNRLCKRILMFHRFEELGTDPCLVRSTELNYVPSSINGSGQSEVTYLKTAVQAGCRRMENGTYSKKVLPPFAFEYQELNWDRSVHKVSAEALENTPVGLTGNYQWTDLYGEGISGILTEQDGNWYYKENRGAFDEAGVQFSPLRQIAARPSVSGFDKGVLALQDIEANGKKQLLVRSSGLTGFYELNTSDVPTMDIGDFTAYASIPNIDWGDPNVRFIDLNGDGRPELVVSEEHAFLWYESLGKEGYSDAVTTLKPTDEDKGPALVFADTDQSIYLADFSGDGLTDIVRIRNGEVCYWPNLGYGHFGAKVTMDNVPIFDFADAYHPKYLHLADVSGTGTTDLVYLGANSCKAFLNLSGNGWSEAHEIAPFVPIDGRGEFSVIDLLGTGTACVVWSSDLPEQHPMRYIDLMGSVKPHVLAGYSNGTGKEVSISYKSSTYFYLKHKREGRPWITKLPFPVQVIEKMTVTDHISSSAHCTSYAYHHGYYDYEEREFRGFGRIDQIDQESFDAYREEDALDMPPLLTKTWIHTGAYRQQSRFSKQYQEEYYTDDALAYWFPDSVVEEADHLSFQDLREAVRSLKGSTLRKEVYSLDGSAAEDIPYTITERNFTVRRVQPAGKHPYGVYQSLGRETLTYYSERNTADPRIAHQFALEYDEYGHPLQSLEVAYPRRSGIPNIYPEQMQLQAILRTMSYRHETGVHYRLGIPTGQRQYEINGLVPAADIFFTLEEVRSQLSTVLEVGQVLEHQEAFTTGVQARLIGATDFFYQGGDLEPLALPDYSEQLVMSTDWIDQAYDGKATTAMLEEAGYLQKEGQWWIRSDRPSYLDADAFYLPFRNEDVFGNVSTIEYDPYHLTAISATDALENTVRAEIDYRTLSVRKMTDINDSVSEAITDELGMVIATTVYGTEDGLQKGDLPIDQYVSVENTDLEAIINDPLSHLQGTTTYFYYHLESWETGALPPHFVRLSRETHVSELATGQETTVQISLGYSDGFGRELQSKIKYDEEQWLVSGRTIYNNKEMPVKQYEPFFADTYAFQSEEEVGPVGVSPILYYDALGRLIKTETPDSFHTRVEFDPWQVRQFDQNDTVLDSKNYAENSSLPPITDPKKMALDRASEHYDTPSTMLLDTLGRSFRTEQLAEAGADPLVTYTEFDIQGNPLTQTDPRQYMENQSRSETDKIHNFQYTYDLLGHVVRTISRDAGTTYNLLNVRGNPLYAWNARDYRTRATYDALHRPLETLVEGPDLNITAQKMVYGTDRGENQNGEIIQSFDQSGKRENLSFSFKGEVLHSTQQLCSDYKAEPDWSDESTVALEPEVYHSKLTYDALGRVIASMLPDGSVHLPSYHHIGWLKGVTVKLRETDFGEESDALLTTFVDQINYDAKGQRTQLVYGNGVSTSYTYDEKTFRLTALLTQRPEANGAPSVLQDIQYIYDPVGNIIRITDHSHDRVFNANQQVDPVMEYTYDALYQLATATGRQHLVLNKNSHQQHADAFWNNQFAQLNDASQLTNYTRNYTYDTSGNLIQIRQTGGNAFTRTITPSATSNRAITDEMNANIPVEEQFDAAGNLQQLEHLAGIRWTYRNHIASATIIERQVEDENGQLIDISDAEYYVYDAGGQRTRKVKETYNRAGDLLWVEEKRYLGGVEIKRRYQGNNRVLKEDRSTVLISDNQKRIALVHYWEVSNDTSITIDTHKIHYQLGNHLGSTALELNEQGLLISYEEYFPFGGTAFTTGSILAEVKLKEYRYTGKERDGTTGLYYYGARYYAPWMGRWLNPDPAGTVDGLNVFQFVRNNPIKLFDRQGLAEDNFDQLNFGQAPAYYQTVRATAAGRGINSKDRGNLRSAWITYGGDHRVKLDAGHIEPFALTPAGEEGPVYAQPRSQNRGIGATQEKQLVQQVRDHNKTATEKIFVRDTKGGDPNVPKGTRFGPHPDENPNFEGTRRRAEKIIEERKKLAARAAAAPEPVKPKSPVVSDTHKQVDLPFGRKSPAAPLHTPSSDVDARAPAAPERKIGSRSSRRGSTTPGIMGKIGSALSLGYGAYEVFTGEKSVYEAFAPQELIALRQGDVTGAAKLYGEGYVTGKIIQTVGSKIPPPALAAGGIVLSAYAAPVALSAYALSESPEDYAARIERGSNAKWYGMNF